MQHASKKWIFTKADQMQFTTKAEVAFTLAAVA